MPAALDLSGKRYGRLVAQLRIKGSRNKQSGWECMCDCGNKKFVKTELLVKGKVR